VATGCRTPRPDSQSSPCLFRVLDEIAPEGNIVLAQHRDIQDPSTDGAFTVKRFRRSGSTVSLEPANPEFTAIEVKERKGQEVRVVAELIEVLSPDRRSRNP
jgi:SOS-response transcriptional repressor LexA